MVNLFMTTLSIYLQVEFRIHASNSDHFGLSTSLHT